MARELMTPRPITLSPEAPVSRALGLMRSHHIHELPVLRRNRLNGMVTFESIARRTNLPLSTKVEHLLVLPPEVTPTTPYPEVAEQLLAAGLRAAPVVGRKGELVGVISRTDLVRAIPGLSTIARHTVDEVLDPTGLVLNEHQPIGTLFAQIRLLEEHPLAVVDAKQRLVGALGIADLGKVMWRPNPGGKRDRPRHGRDFDIEIRTVMHSPAVTVEKGTLVGEVARLMTREKVSSVFVEEMRRPIGIVSQVGLLGLAVAEVQRKGGTQLGDVFVQVTGMRGSAEPETYTELDRVVANGLRHISRHVKPILLSLHVSPHATHRSGDATVEARLHSDRGIFFASRTEWSFFAAVAALLDELEVQTRRVREESRRKRQPSARRLAPDDTPGDPELEARIRLATGEE